MPEERRASSRSNANSSSISSSISAIACLVGLVGVAVVGCEARASDLPADARVRVDTVNGVEHVVSGERGAWVEGASWSVADSMLVIGTVDGPEETVFGRVAGVAIGADGRIYVADGQALEVRVFSPRGAFLSRFGRSGEGPGEFRDISGLGFTPAGQLAVLDGVLGRLSFFSPDGEFSRSLRLERPYIQQVQRPLWFDRRGRFFDRVDLSHDVYVDSLGLMVYGPGGELQHTLLAAVDRPTRIYLTRGGRPYASLSVPFTPGPAVAVGPDGDVYSSDGAAYRIVVRTASGDTLRVLQRDVEPPLVEDRERQAAATALRDRIDRDGGPQPKTLPIPVHKPAITGLTVDADGDLWVRTPMGPGWTRVEYGVFAPDGHYLGALSMPAVRITEITTSLIAGIQVDSTGVERVAIMTLRKPAGR